MLGSSWQTQHINKDVNANWLAATSVSWCIWLQSQGSELVWSWASYKVPEHYQKKVTINHFWVVYTLKTLQLTWWHVMVIFHLFTVMWKRKSTLSEFYGFIYTTPTACIHWDELSLIWEVLSNLVICNYTIMIYICCCLVVKSCPTLRDPMDRSTPGPPVFHNDIHNLPISFL